jgi:hypothetical protein
VTADATAGVPSSGVLAGESPGEKLDGGKLDGEQLDGGQPRFVITGGAGPAEVAAVVTVLSAAAAASAATATAAGSAAATPDAAGAVPDGRSRRPLWSVSLGPALRSAITWRTSGWW